MYLLAQTKQPGKFWQGPTGQMAKGLSLRAAPKAIRLFSEVGLHCHSNPKWGLGTANWSIVAGHQSPDLKEAREVAISPLKQSSPSG